MPRYEFTVTLSGEGDTEEEAWLDAVNAFCDDPGEPPDDATLEDNDEEPSLAEQDLYHAFIKAKFFHEQENQK
jgi:hypothetical protein